LKQAHDWLEKEHGIEASRSTVHRYVRKAGGSLKVPRPRGGAL
jgi:transposase